MKTLIKYCILFMPLIIWGQINYTKIPINRQLVGRDINTNLGEVLIEGTVNSAETPYESIHIDVFRDDMYDSSLSQSKVLVYHQEEAPFNFNINIPAELNNYSFQIYGKLNNQQKILEKSIDSIVAGDAYIIQGQSNAEAMIRTGSSSSNEYKSDFIRVYARGYISGITTAEDVNDEIYENDKWYIGQGDGPSDSNGNTGQWGLKLAKLIENSQNIPIAIFNGAQGGSTLWSHRRYSANPTSGLYAPYQQLLYRIDKTGLRDFIRGVFWSQGEADGTSGYLTSTDEYKTDFLTIRDWWLEDYPEIEKIYIFQTKNSIGCDVISSDLMKIKEAQRQLALEYTDIHVMQTAALHHLDDNCHFTFINGYESFASRIIKLVERDLYNNLSYSKDIEPPMILDAFLTNNKTLVVETDAIELFMDNPVNIQDFKLENAATSTILSINVLEGNIIFNLSENPGSSATISFYAQDTGVSDFITNTEDLELTCFNEFPIDIRFTEWNGSWSNGIPDYETHAIINGDYNSSIGNIEANDLTINSGHILNFDNGNTNSVVVAGNLTINGTFIIGDQESLVMYDDNAIITGIITKKENSTIRNDARDITYWSTPVENETVENVFSNVTSSRIWFFDQSETTSSDPNNDPNGTYWNVWKTKSGTLIPGRGVAAEGPTGEFGVVHDVEFNGKPNNGIIAIDIFRQADGDTENDFNLVGNPYPSAINIQSFFTINQSVIDQTIYLWTHTKPLTGGDFIATDYAIRNFTGGVGVAPGEDPGINIGSSQGFMIRALESSMQTLRFSNIMRMADSNDQFFKSFSSKDKSNIESEEQDFRRLWLNLTSDKGGFSQILVGFHENATDEGIDNGYDSKVFNNDKPLSLYSNLANGKYAIQTLGQLKDEKEVSLGFDSQVAPRTLTIGIEKFDGITSEDKILLIDNYLNKIHDLRKGDYSFNQIEMGSYPDRFILKLTRSNTGDLVNGHGKKMTIVNNFNNLNVEANEIVKSIKVYDVLGRMIIQSMPNKRRFELNVSGVKMGTLILIEAKLENDMIIKKKALRY